MMLTKSFTAMWRRDQKSTLMSTAHIQHLNKQGFQHAFVRHAETYVDGAVHTNGIENFWSLLKRTVRGTYVSCEPFHMFRYLDEQAYRFNERYGNDRDRFVGAMKGIMDRRLTYKLLTGKHDGASREESNGEGI